MSTTDPTAVARFRYTVIAPLVTRALAYGEHNALLRDIVAQPWTDPTGRPRPRHARTVERWGAAYRAGGFDALQPQPRGDRGAVRGLPPAVLTQALALRAEDPHRSARQVIHLLELAGVVPPGTVKYSTLTRHFRQEGVVPPPGPRPADTFRRRQAPYPNAEWQADTQLVLKMPDPHQPARLRQVYLVAVLDDATRYVVGAECFFHENRLRLEQVLKWAVVRHGVPEIFHCDNGSIYASGYLTRVCAELGIALRHSTVRRPEGKGKIERWFRRGNQELTHELRALIAQGPCRTLADLNRYLQAWIRDSYHVVPHHGLGGQTPAAAWAAGQATHPARPVTLATLHDVFLGQETRRVDKTGVIQLAGNRYEVASVLARRVVECRYDPGDLQQIHIRYQGQAYPDAVPLTLHHHRATPRPPTPRRRRRPRVSTTPHCSPPRPRRGPPACNTGRGRRRTRNADRVWRYPGALHQGDSARRPVPQSRPAGVGRAVAGHGGHPGARRGLAPASRRRCGNWRPRGIRSGIPWCIWPSRR